MQAAGLALAVMLLPHCCVADSTWHYAEPGEDEANPAVQDEWEEVSATCAHGAEQSPINIVTADVPVMDSLKPIDIEVEAEIDHLTNTGHGFQVFETTPYSSTYLSDHGVVDLISTNQTKGNTTIGGDVYNFYQFHFHAPSENTIDGKSFAMEVHAVHQLQDPVLVGTNHRLMVVASLFDLTDECNEALDVFWDQFPLTPGDVKFEGSATISVHGAENWLITGSGYYYWHGSLTTPDCTEGVRWYLLKQVSHVCQRQLDHLQDALRASMEGVSINNRVVQPLNHRVVVQTPPCRLCVEGDGVDVFGKPERRMLFSSLTDLPCCPKPRFN